MSTTLLQPQYGDTRDGYTPSPEEIRRRCAAIQAGWSAREERSRRQWSVDREELVTHEGPDLEALAAS